MTEESTIPDLTELVRRNTEAVNRRDLDAALSMLKPDVVWDMSPVGLGVHEGLAAIREFWEDWIGAYEDYEIEPEQILDLGHGVTFTVVMQSGRLVGSTGDIALRYAAVSTWADGLAERITNYADVDEGRAAAERLAASRG